ncbi:hypothetical protein [Azonexus sp. IMCC34839]|uniref:hypothetical protein n=1 Tax=Azonexus sp. IMCC34839 TaxID=3133695 RepID=UPI00399C0D8C
MAKIVSIDRYSDRRHDEARIEFAEAMICAGLQMLGARLAKISYLDDRGLPIRMDVKPDFYRRELVGLLMEDSVRRLVAESKEKLPACALQKVV